MSLRNYLKECNEVYHLTLNPKGIGSVRIHLVPPKKRRPGVPWVVILNGYNVLPLQTSWAILLKEFILAMEEYDGKSLSGLDIKDISNKTIGNVRKVFPKTPKNVLEKDLNEIVQTLKDVAYGKEPSSEIGYLTLAKYAKYMTAPHRVDLLVSSMEKNGCWHCNQKCLHCYAANEKLSQVQELSTEEWKKILDSLKKSYVPTVTFTGGEPTLRKDLCELVEYGKWFVTRLNTNGILLSKELCDKLYEASLDSVQITFYSYDKEIHNTLVGGDHFDETVEGIKNALASGLDVSVNTPLCSLNQDYFGTIKFLESLGVTYFSCSGLIPTGNALSEASQITRLSKEEITLILQKVYAHCRESGSEISFTSPGWIDADVLQKMRLVVPSCGACLSNMAIAPNGEVIPCQSWLFEDGLGNILNTNFKTIWNSKKCKEQREKSVHIQNVCHLNEVKK